MKIINGKLKSINGDVIIDSCNARVKLDLTDLSNSIFVTDDIFMLIKKYWKENLIFEVNKYKKFIITESSWSLNQYIKFNIKEYHFIQNKREFFTYCSGCVKGLLYYQDEFNFNNYHFICKRINKSDQYYWEIDSKEEIKKEELFLIFMILSTITGSKHFIRSSSKPTGEIVYYDYYSKSKRLTIYGSAKKTI